MGTLLLVPVIKPLYLSKIAHATSGRSARAEGNKARAMSGSARNVTCKARAIIPFSWNLQEQDQVHHRQGCDGVGSLGPATLLLCFRHGGPFFQLGPQRPLDGRPWAKKLNKLRQKVLVLPQGPPIVGHQNHADRCKLRRRVASFGLGVGGQTCGPSKRRELKPCEQCFSAYTAPLLETHTPLNAHLQRGHNNTSISRICSYVPKTMTLRFKTKSGAVMHNNANYQHR